MSDEQISAEERIRRSREEGRWLTEVQFALTGDTIARRAGSGRIIERAVVVERGTSYYPSHEHTIRWEDGSETKARVDDLMHSGWKVLAKRRPRRASEYKLTTAERDYIRDWIVREVGEEYARWEERRRWAREHGFSASSRHSEPELTERHFVMLLPVSSERAGLVKELERISDQGEDWPLARIRQVVKAALEWNYRTGRIGRSTGYRGTREVKCYEPIGWAE